MLRGPFFPIFVYVQLSLDGACIHYEGALPENPIVGEFYGAMSDCDVNPGESCRPRESCSIQQLRCWISTYRSKCILAVSLE